MKEVRNNPKIDSNAPAKDTTRHPKRSHNALDIGPKKKFKPMAMAPIQAMERSKKHNLNVWRNMLLFLSRAWSGGNFCVLPRWIDPRPYAYHHPNASHSKSISCKCYASFILSPPRFKRQISSLLTFHFLYMQFYSSEKSVLHQYNISHSWYFCSLSKTFYVYVLILLEDVYSLAAWEWKVNCHISYLSQSLWMQSAPNDKKKNDFSSSWRS